VTRPASLAPIAAAATMIGAACAGTAAAQEMLSMPSATSPSPGVLIPRVQARAYFFDGGQALLEEAVRLEYGIARDLSVSAELPMYQGSLDAPRPSDGKFGLGDMSLLVELRILREDLNAVDTVRVALFGGAELPTGTAGFASDSVNPVVGAVVSSILGRNGFDASARYTFVTGDGMTNPIFVSDTADDFTNIDLGYAFRLYPEAYGEEREAAWYATVELNSTFTVGGEREVLLSPGVLIEAPRFAVELGLQVPVSSRLDGQPDLQLAAIAGLRLLF